MTTRKRRGFSHRSTLYNRGGAPKYEVGDKIGDFTVVFYMGHSLINKRNHRIMAKAQHWYRCLCNCGVHENRSQQELVDTRRRQQCAACRDQEVTE